MIDVRDQIRYLLGLLLIAGTLTGCDVQTYDDAVAGFEGSSAVPPPPPTPTPTPTPPPAGFNPVFSEIQANVFTPNCEGCHSGGNPDGGLSLEAANSYAQLVGITSIQDPALERVTPTDPTNSYLIQKMEGNASGGGIMPPSGMMAQTTIDVVRQWIIDGAMDDTVVPPAAPIQVSSLMPGLNANLQAPPAAIVVGFDRELDATSVNATTFTLVRSGGDGIFGNAGDQQIVAASILVPAANPQSAVFDLTGVVLVDDTYRITLVGTGGTVIMDLDGNALDGEFGGAFDSGNGVAGGDFVSQFTITTPVVIGPTLDQIQTIVFTPTCATAGCHNAVTLAGNLNLSDADTSHVQLVGVASTANAAILRVAVMDPNNSYLIQKLEGAAGTGAQMPLGGLPLDPTVIAEIRQWIQDGALR